MAPLSSSTSTSTVGLPRLSRISRARTSAMTLIGRKLLVGRGFSSGPTGAEQVTVWWLLLSPGALERLVGLPLLDARDIVAGEDLRILARIALDPGEDQALRL